MTPPADPGGGRPLARWLPEAWSRRPLVPLLLLAAALLLWRLGGHGLWESTEARYAEIAARMVRSGDWLVPRLNFIEHWDKPPFAYWATAAGLTVLGIGEIGARLGLVLAALATIAVAYRWTSERAGPAAGLFAGLSLLSAPLFFALARNVSADLYLTLWVWVALYAGHRGSRSGAHRGWRLGAWAALALALLTKGPVALLWTAVPALAWSAWTGRWARLRRLLDPWGIAAAVVISAPWVVWAIVRRPELAEYWLGGQTVGRITAPYEGEGDPVWAYLPVLAWAAGPWIVPATIGLTRRWRKSGLRCPPWLALHVLVPLVLFSLFPTKRANYLLPVLPAIAIAAGSWWDRASRERGGGGVVAALSALSAAFGAALLVAGRLADVPAPLPALGPFLGPAFLLGALAMLLARRRARLDLAFAGLVAPLLGLYLAGFTALGRPAVEQWFKVSRPLAAAAAARPERPIVALHDWPRAFPFYLDERIVTVTADGRTTGFERDSTWTRWVFTDEDELTDPRFEGALFVVPRWARDGLEDALGRELEVVAGTRRLLLLADPQP